MNIFSCYGIYYKKMSENIKNLMSIILLLKNEKGINPSYNNNHKTNTQALLNADPNAAHMVKIVSIFDKVK